MVWRYHGVFFIRCYQEQVRKSLKKNDICMVIHSSVNELEDLWKLFSALQFYYQTLAEAISLTFPTSCAVLHIFLGNNCRALQIVLGQLKQSSNSFGWRIWDKIWGHILAFANEDLTVERCWLLQLWYESYSLIAVPFISAHTPERNISMHCFW